MIRLGASSWVLYLAQNGADIPGRILDQSLAVFVTLFILVVGLRAEWWVPGTTHRRVVAERDRLLELALGTLQVLNRHIQATEEEVMARMETSEALTTRELSAIRSQLGAIQAGKRP